MNNAYKFITQTLRRFAINRRLPLQARVIAGNWLIVILLRELARRQVAR